MKFSLHAIALSVLASVTFLTSYPGAAIGATVDVAIAPGGELVFSPSSVTIHPGDQVRWTFSSAGHTTTSGSPGMPNGIWDSGLRPQGATFTQTFNNTGTFVYYCTPHGGCCGMVGNVRVVSSTPTPTPPPMPGPPVVVTSPATLVASFSARLNGSVNPHGLPTTFHFQYGLTTGYGLTTPPQNRNGNAPQNVSANATNLMANRVYHFRIVASNARGTRFGADRTFTTRTPTGPPVVTTNPATNVARNSARLNGLVYPHGLSTTINFQYGPTTSYGSTTPTQTRTGNTYQNIGANITGLMPNRLYHFRIKATNTGGTRFGVDRIFTTRP